MKKIALVLTVIMLFSCVIVFTACSNKSGATMEDKISEEVENALIAKIVVYNLINGKSYIYTKHTDSIKTVEEGKKFTVKGTVYVLENGTGKTYSTSYSGSVEYDAEQNDFDSDVEIGNFR